MRDLHCKSCKRWLGKASGDVYGLVIKCANSACKRDNSYTIFSSFDVDGIGVETKSDDTVEAEAQKSAETE